MARNILARAPHLLVACIACTVACVELDPALSTQDAAASSPSDAGTSDGASPEDAGVMDARGASDATVAPEASAEDTSARDTSTGDTRAEDASGADTAVAAEAGTPSTRDAGVMDGSAGDASAGDTSASDASERDARAGDASVRDAASGACGAQLSCGTTCAPRSYGFDDGTLSGAYLYQTVSMGVVTPITSTTAQVHGGLRSLSLGMQVLEGAIGYFIVEIPLCMRPQTTAQAGATMSAYLYFDGPALPADADVNMHWSAPGYYGGAGRLRDIVPKQWTLLSGAVPSDNSDIWGFGITITLRAPWTGTIYFDDLVVQ